MKLWLDDLRKPPDDTWTWVRTYEECIRQFRSDKTFAELVQAEPIEVLSLDHDLGTPQTGYDVVRWIERRVAEFGMVPPKLEVHSQNVVGRANILAAIASIERLMPRRHDGCGGVVLWDAEVDSTGRLYGPYDSYRCSECGATNFLED